MCVVKGVTILFCFPVLLRCFLGSIDKLALIQCRLKNAFDVFNVTDMEAWVCLRLYNCYNCSHFFCCMLLTCMMWVCSQIYPIWFQQFYSQSMYASNLDELMLLFSKRKYIIKNNNKLCPFKKKQECINYV